MDVVNKIDVCLKECLEKSNKTEDELFEIFNRLLNNYRQKSDKTIKLKKKLKTVFVYNAINTNTMIISGRNESNFAISTT